MKQKNLMILLFAFWVALVSAPAQAALHFDIMHSAHQPVTHHEHDHGARDMQLSDLCSLVCGLACKLALDVQSVVTIAARTPSSLIELARQSASIERKVPVPPPRQQR